MTAPPTLFERSAGTLLHPTSLPGEGSAGDIGAAAFRFADFLADAGVRWWQMLPIHPPGAVQSPYDALSAFAGAPALVALEPLVDAGWLTPEEALPPPTKRAVPRRGADLRAAARHKHAGLRLAFSRFHTRASPAEQHALASFREAERAWLEDFALFCALRERHRGRPWMQWPRPLRERDGTALREAAATLAEHCAYHAFVQWLFARQWQALRAHCAARGIGLMGDVPIYVAQDSADVWANRSLFDLTADGHPRKVAGVPPDAFSATGQRWGNPLYRWDVLAEGGYTWWIDRFRRELTLFDGLRLDHFIGFVRYWEIPADDPDARQGSYRPGPGEPFFRAVEAALGGLPFVAEDLGNVTPPVTALRERLGIPGMRVLQFAFGGDAHHPYLPHHHTPDSVVYTGTHDNDTLVGWWRTAPRAVRSHAADYAGRKRLSVPAHLVRMAYASPARLAIVPVQDWLALGSASRMNRPGSTRGNWRWRLDGASLSEQLAHALSQLGALYGR